jgi:hypothetical protein
MNLQKRKKILNNLISFSKNIKELDTDLKKMRWDLDIDIVILKKENIEAVLTKLKNNQISGQDLEDWANLIECREDIGFDSDDTKLKLEELANPTLFKD